MSGDGFGAEGARLPAGLEVAGLIRRCAAAGGNAMVLHKGDADAGTLLVVLLDRDHRATLWERLPQADGARVWTQTASDQPDDPTVFAAMLDRRAARDPDLWIVELAIAGAERFALNG